MGEKDREQEEEEILQEFKDVRRICQVCGSNDPIHYGLVKELPSGAHTYMENFHLCEGCGDKLVNGIQVAIPDIVEEKE